MLIVSKRNTGGGTAGYGFIAAATSNCNLSANGGNFLCFLINDGTDTYRIYTSTRLNADSVWHHVAAVLDRTNENNTLIYLDGLAQPITRIGILSDIDSLASGTELCIGREVAGSGCATATDGNTFNGNIDEVRIYNRAFSPKEISDLYNFAPGPVGYWNFEEKTGTVANDTSGNGYNSSSFTGNTAWASGKYGAGLSFDGTDDVVRIVEGTYTNLGVGVTVDSYTVEAWIKTNTNYSANATVVAKDDGTGAYPFELYLNSSEYACFDVYDGTNTPSACGTTALNDGKWHYLTGVRDILNDKLYLYVNGILITSTADSTTATVANDADVSIGNGGTSYTANDFNGAIDEVRLYNYARTQKQIVEDMQGGSPSTSSGRSGSQIAYWEFDEGYGANANDSTPNNNNLTLSSASWTNSGRFGKAWNGTGALWLSRADDSDFDFSSTDDFAISLWYKSDSANNPGAVEYLFNKANATTAGYAVYANTSGNLCFGID
ncbi:LamG domain-containing protein, partial [candidate division WWE3 bacterium]|nr:LamG domain-containing protein [candidate division WWE3 bacterium]